MKAVFVAGICILAFFLQNIFSVILLRSTEPPLFFLAIFYFLWTLERSAAIFFVCVSAIFLETLSLYPSGSYIVALCFLTLFVFFIKIHIIRVETKWILGGTAAVFLFLLGILLEGFAFFTALVHGVPYRLTIYIPSLLFWSLFWGVCYGIVLSYGFFTKKTAARTFA